MVGETLGPVDGNSLGSGVGEPLGAAVVGEALVPSKGDLLGFNAGEPLGSMVAGGGLGSDVVGK